MAMPAAEIEALIKAAFPDAQVTIEDLAGDGDHYAAKVVSEAFRGRSRVQQHQLVYAALQGRMGGALHALALQTSAPPTPVQGASA
ncbi:BolA family protein [Teichococcus vastitatis]|jgi:stress-induced morphogen|uniref:BolA family transcriptional regulator n=1 Tax=Teichococcus vastitatis TaxID=2307076 RepID=A0ABS9W5R2_9PROT|nr:BolA family transcriptional regulator [Pseudoroseomonas vastitatis]MCI0754558.1 BolA family transcriptional regulator [Pseudoroseomonas vastitatis]